MHARQISEADFLSARDRALEDLNRANTPAELVDMLARGFVLPDGSREWLDLDEYRTVAQRLIGD